MDRFIKLLPLTCASICIPVLAANEVHQWEVTLIFYLPLMLISLPAILDFD